MYNYTISMLSDCMVLVIFPFPFCFSAVLILQIHLQPELTTNLCDAIFHIIFSSFPRKDPQGLIVYFLSSQILIAPYIWSLISEGCFEQKQIKSLGHTSFTGAS
jgi:hypothetical protein